MPNGNLLFIDRLRGIAILMVIAVHQAQPFVGLSGASRAALDYGQFGVQLFFVASAYTLCNSAYNRGGVTRDFYLRRFFRIAPLYYLGIALYGTLQLVKTTAFPETGTEGYEYSFASVTTNILFVHGFSPDYFNNVVPGGWSIGTEMAFYAIFPFLLPVCKRAFHSGGVAALLVMTMLTLTLNITIQLAIGAISNNNFYYCLILNQLPVFLIGIIAFIVHRDGKMRPRLRRDVPAFAIATVGCYMLLHSVNPMATSMMPTAAGVSFFFLLNIAMAMAKREGLIEKIGQASYSMYVLHFVFAWFATSLVLRIVPALHGWSELAYLGLLCMTISASYTGARLTKALIEDRGIKLGRAIIAVAGRRNSSTGIPGNS